MTDEEIHIIRRFAQLASALMDATGKGSYGGAPQAARALVNEWEQRFQRIGIRHEGYGTPKPEDLQAAELVKESFREQMAQRGRDARTAALIHTADQIEKITTDMWAIVPHVLVEAEAIAKSLREEAHSDAASKEENADVA